MTTFGAIAQTCVNPGTPGNQLRASDVSLSVDEFGNVVATPDEGKLQIAIAAMPEEQGSATLEIIDQACDAVEIRSKQRKKRV